MAKTKTAKAADTTPDAILQLDPDSIIAENNTRFQLDPSHVEDLKADILNAGGVINPVLVSRDSDGGFHLIAGFGRHAAVQAANKEGAGLKLPAILRSPADEKARLEDQLRENVKRRNLSPMDTAVAIKKMFDQGYTRAQIREFFGTAGKPMSNAWVNMTQDMLELPKSIQAKVHSGRVGLQSAYQLMRVKPEDREAVLAKAEQMSQDFEEASAKDEEKFLKLQEKVEKEQAKVQEVTQKFDAATEAVLAAQQLVDEKAEALKAAGKLPDNYMEMSAAEKKAQTEKFNAAKKDVEGAMKELDRAKKAMEAINAAKAKAASGATAAKKAAAKAKAPKPVKTEAVKSAVAEKAQKPTSLSAAAIKDVVVKLSAAKGKGARAVGAALGQCFAGVMSVGSLVTEIEVICGDRQKVKA